VIEKLSKFGGERVEPLTPGEYTQLTGRAGRRGTDEVGYAVALWAPGVSFDQVASLAGARSYTLTSSFRPTYNMATNLVRRTTPEQAHHLLNLSFAQYRADADVVRFESSLERARQELTVATEEATCELGDVSEYRRRTEPGVDGREPGAVASPARPWAIVAAMEGLRPGDVLLVPARKPGGARTTEKVAVLSTSQRKKGDLSLRAITTSRRLISLGVNNFQSPPVVVARLELPAPFAPKNRDFQRRVALSLAAADSGPPGPANRAERRALRAAEGLAVASCPDIGRHLRADARAERLARQVERLERQVKGRTDSLARQFDKVLQLLERWGYVRGWSLTPAGARLARIYHPQDLLVAESAERALLDGLAPAEIAGAASVFTYEARGPLAAEAAAPRLPNRRLEERWHRNEAVARELNADEEALGLPLTRPPDSGFVTLAHGWAKGKDLATLLAPAEEALGTRSVAISAGDFVRNVKQLTDLLRQLGEVLPDEGSAESARRAAEALFRGLVAASSVIPAPDTGNGTGTGTGT
jgi:ATP-dependent RNA helicase HelY